MISDIDSDACSLSWNKPLEDGGSNITNYVVEKCDVSRGDWVTAVSVSKTSCRLGKLIPGKEYMFRIRAENRFGVSDPVQSDRMVAKFPFGRSDFVLLSVDDGNASFIYTYILCSMFFTYLKMLVMFLLL